MQLDHPCGVSGAELHSTLIYVIEIITEYCDGFEY